MAVQPEIAHAPIIPVLGGGPAGMSCALWLSNYGLRPLIIEAQATLGGMAGRDPYPNPWLLGRPGLRGRDNAAEFARHIEAIKIECWLGARPLTYTVVGSRRGFVADHDAPQRSDSASRAVFWRPFDRLLASLATR